jgi:hypothetical protein
MRIATQRKQDKGLNRRVWLGGDREGEGCGKEGK